MTEQEQATVLARWLEQPAGTPPPEGLDPEVVESIYAMRPELAPELSLSADDILDGFDWGAGGVAGAVSEADDDPATLSGAAMPRTEVRSAPPAWRSANRVAGVAVVLATAATLLLVVLPNGGQFEPAQDAAAPQAAEVAAGPASSVSADPIASVGDEPSEEAAASAPPQAIAEAPAQQQAPLEDLVGGQLDDANAASGDAVADALLEEDEEALDFASDQRTRFEGNEGAIPEVEEAMRQEEAQAWDPEPVDAPVAAAPSTAPAEPQAAPSYDYADEDAYGGKGRANKRAGSRRDQAAAEPSGADGAADDAVSYRAQARPSDYSSGFWRSSTSAGTQTQIDDAVRFAQTELGLGNLDKAVELLAPHITTPAAAGQYVAIVSAEMQLASGAYNGAANTAQQGLRLDSSNTAARAKLLEVYGNALYGAGDPASAEAQWQAAASLNATR